MALLRFELLTGLALLGAVLAAGGSVGFTGAGFFAGTFLPAGVGFVVTGTVRVCEAAELVVELG